MMSVKRKNTRGAMIVGAVFVGVLASSNSSRDSRTAGIMNGIYSAVTELLPISFAVDAYRDPKNRDKIIKNLNIMESQAAKLSEHGQTKEAGFRDLSRTFAMDVRHIRKNFSELKYQASRFHLLRVVDRCVSCHSKLPEGKKFPSADTFFKDVAIGKLPPLEKARLEVAMRQFDRALTELDGYLGSPDVLTKAAYGTDAFETYFKLTLRVKKDPARALALVQKLQKRKKLPKYLKRNLKIWNDDLVNLSKTQLLQSADPTVATQLIDSAKKKMEYETDRNGLVQYAAGSSILHSFVSANASGSKKASADSISNAYLYLGISELLLNRSFWLSDSRLYLEEAIHVSAASDSAQRAYKLLEEQVHLGFSGSAGINIPDDIAQWLKALRAETIAAKKAASKG